MGFIESQVEKTYGRFILHMAIAAKLLYAQYWKNTEKPKMEEWIVNMIELSEMTKMVRSKQ